MHKDLPQIEDCLFQVNGFVHYNLDLPHLAPHQVLTEDDSQLKVRLHHLLEACFLIGNELDRVATDLENLEKSGNLKETFESQGICDRIPKVREKSGNFVV